MRPLRALSPDLSHLRAARDGDGLTAGPDLPHPRPPRGENRPDRSHLEPSRPVPRLPRLRERLPEWSSLRCDPRGGARRTRANPKPSGGYLRPSSLRIPEPAFRATLVARGGRSPSSGPRLPGFDAWPHFSPPRSGAPRSVRRSRAAMPSSMRPRRSFPRLARYAGGSAFSSAVPWTRSTATSTAPPSRSRAPASEVAVPRDQTCCGALQAHNGARGIARDLVARNLASFEGLEAVVVNSAGCGAQLAELESLFPASHRSGHAIGRTHAFSARCIDLSTFLQLRLGCPEPRGAAGQWRTGPDPRGVRRSLPPPPCPEGSARPAQAAPPGSRNRTPTAHRVRLVLWRGRHLQPDATDSGRPTARPEAGPHRGQWSAPGDHGEPRLHD